MGFWRSLEIPNYRAFIWLIESNAETLLLYLLNNISVGYALNGPKTGPEGNQRCSKWVLS